MPRPRVSMVVRCVPGLEGIVQQELRALSVASRATSPGTVFAKHVSSKELYASNALLRCATRILVPACSFTARSFSDLELACKRMAREDALLSSFLVPGARLRVRVHAAANSPLFHTSAVAERVARHLSLPAEPSFSRGSEGTGGVPEPPEQRLDVLVEGEWVKILVDASGDALHDRGWRMDRGAKMPLKESVAAGLLHAVGWVHSPAGLAAAATPEPASGFGALLDPFCGSGTIPIEAALLSIGMPAHFLSGRSFALQRWPSFEPGTWGAVTAEMGRRAARADQRRGRAPPIAASDRDAGAVSLARANAEAAGVADLVEFRHCAVSDVTPPRLRSSSGAATGKAQGGGVGKPGLLLTNPPWGVRSGTAQAEAAALDSLYWRIGQVHKAQLKGYELAVLVNDWSLAGRISRNLRPTLDVSVGGQRARLMASPGAGLQVNLGDKGRARASPPVRRLGENGGHGAAQESVGQSRGQESYGTEVGGELGEKSRHGVASAMRVRKPTARMAGTLAGPIGGRRVEGFIL